MTLFLTIILGLATAAVSALLLLAATRDRERPQPPLKYFEAEWPEKISDHDLAKRVELIKARRWSVVGN